MKPPTASRRSSRAPGAATRPSLTLAFCGLATAFAVVAPLSTTACASKDGQAQTTLDYTDNARRDYELALAAFEDKNWELANELLSEVKRKYAYSRYARLAERPVAAA